MIIYLIGIIVGFISLLLYGINEYKSLTVGGLLFCVIFSVASWGCIVAIGLVELTDYIAYNPNNIFVKEIWRKK